MGMLIWTGLICCGLVMADTALAILPGEIDPGLLSGRPVSCVDINIIGPEKDKSRWLDMASTLIELSGGDIFSPVLFRQSLDRLTDCGRFADVAGAARQEGETVTLRFDLTVNRVIREIDIHFDGRDGIFKSDILDVMSVYPGRAFSAGEIDRQKGIIAELLDSRGFSSPTIEITPLEDKDDYTLLLDVAISLGPWKAIGAVHITGNSAFSDLRLKSRMHTWRKFLFYRHAARLNERVVSRDVKALMEFYRRKGYPEASVDYRVEMTGRDNHAAVWITINEGPRYEISFFGNSRISDRVLKKEVVVFSDGNRAGRGIRKSLQNMKSLYRRAGFLRADISLDENVRQTGDKTEKQILFRVREGRQTLVRNLEVLGNTAVSDERIKKQMLTQPVSWLHTGAYVPRVLEADIRAIRRLYREKGFYHVDIQDKTVLSEDNTRADIIIDINEQNRVRVSSVTFDGLQSVKREQALRVLRLSPGTVFAAEAVERDKTELAALISETGHPHVLVSPMVTLSDDGLTADIVYHIEEGPAVKMGRIFVSGNLRTRESVVRREMEMAEGDPFSLTKMIGSQQDLRSFQIFKSVDFTPVGLLEKKERVHLFIQTIEKKPFFMELDAGYNSEQGGGGKVAVGDHNLLGFNRDGHISGKISETGYRGDVVVRSPRFLFPRTASVFNLYFEKSEAFNQDFGVRARGASFGITREWIPALSTTLSLDAENRRQYPLSSSPPDDEAYGRRHAVSLTPGIVYDTRDNAIIPAKGLLGTCHITFSRGINNRPDDFVKYQAAVHTYLSPLDNLTLALTGRAGYIDPQYAATPVADDQLFFLGGISSIRGYAENLLLRDDDGDPVGGRRSLSGTIETRIGIKTVCSLVLFYDAGKLDRTYTPTDTGIRSAVGIGLGYRTPVGPLSLYYGHKLNRKPGESPGRFHFSIGYTF